MDTTTILEKVRRLGTQVEACAERVEGARRLPADLVEALRDAGAFRIGFPAAWGGPEMDIISQCRMVEGLAYHDASVAWVVMICSDSGHYAARLDEEVGRSLYPSLDLLTAGLLAPGGQARRVPGGFRLSGRWSFGSGCSHADRIVGGALLFDGDDMVVSETGRPKFQVYWLPVEEVEIHDTWHTTGLAGSGSHDYSVTDAFVPDGHHFNPFEVGSRPEPLYRYRGFFFANLPAVAIGAAQRMINDLRHVAAEKVVMPSFALLKNEARVRTALAEASAMIGAARAYQDHVLGSIWECLEAGGEPTRAQRAEVGLMSINAVQSGHQVAELVCDAVGSTAIYATSPFERRRRDLATLTAHVIGAHKTYELAGQLLFGDEPTISYF